MSVTSGPLVSTNNVLFSVDAANARSYVFPKKSEHGIADWYCFATGTAVYSAIYPGTTIYQIDDNGTLTVVVPTTTAPTRGTITVTAGYRYFGTRPIHLNIDDFQHALAPLSMSSRLFIYAANRAGSETGTVYFYSPGSAATVTVYKDGTGVAGTAVATVSVPAKGVGTYSITTLGYYYFTSTSAVIASATQINADKTILSPPATNGVYQRFQNYALTSINSAPTGNGAYVTYDSTYPVMNQNIADGSGGDTAQGLGFDYLCDSYSWGGVVSDYVIVSPYADNVVTCSYWDGAKWVVRETHLLTGGSQYNPIQVQRDGSAGVGVSATNISGGVANMVSDVTTLWKWEGTLPFYLCINDQADDELAMLGWMSNNTYRKATNENGGLIDVIGTQSAFIANPPEFDSANNGALNYTNTNNYIYVPYNAALAPTVGVTLECWAYHPNWPGITADCRLLSKTEGGGWQIGINEPITGVGKYGMLIHMNGAYKSASDNLSNLTAGWHHFVGVCDGRYIYVYRDGVQVASFDNGAYGPLTYAVNNNIMLGAESGGGASDSYAGSSFSGKISLTRIYGRALTPSEIKQNFNAVRSRYGI